MENALIDERRIHVDFSQSVSKYWYKYKKGNAGPLDKEVNIDKRGKEGRDNRSRI